MAWNLNDSSPIYLQLTDIIKGRIIAGTYQPGEKLPSVRDLAMEAAVNPNTMQKALSMLERDGLVYTLRTSGRFITEDLGTLTALKETLAREQIEQFLKTMKHLGFSYEEILHLLESTKEGKS